MPKSDKARHHSRVALSPEVWAAVVTHMDFEDLCAVRTLSSGFRELVDIEVRDRVVTLAEQFFPGVGAQALTDLDDLDIVISGSSVVRILADSSSPVHSSPITDLDLYVATESGEWLAMTATRAESFLSRIGYTLAQGPLLENDPSSEAWAEDEYMHNNGEVNVHVEKFIHRKSRRRIDLIVCAQEPIYVIRPFHSTIVKNWIRRGRVICSHPATLGLGCTFITNPGHYYGAEPDFGQHTFDAITAKWRRYGFPLLAGPAALPKPQQLSFTLPGIALHDTECGNDASAELAHNVADMHL